MKTTVSILCYISVLLLTSCGGGGEGGGGFDDLGGVWRVSWEPEFDTCNPDEPLEPFEGEYFVVQSDTSITLTSSTTGEELKGATTSEGFIVSRTDEFDCPDGSVDSFTLMIEVSGDSPGLGRFSRQEITSRTQCCAMLAFGFANQL